MAKSFNSPLGSLERSLLETETAARGSSNHVAESMQEVKPFERRSELRYPSQDPAEIEVLTDPGNLIYATVLDVSRSGMRVALSKPIHRGARVKVKLHHNVICGEIRYCHTVSSTFHAGILIQELVRPATRARQHIADDPLSLYAIGRGLIAAEVIEIREHLVRCESCRVRLGEKEKLLNASKRVRPILKRAE